MAAQEFAGLDESPSDFWIPLTMYRAVKQGEDLFGVDQPARIRLVVELCYRIAPVEVAGQTRLIPVQPDYRVMTAVPRAAAVAALLFELLPTLQAIRMPLTRAIQGKIVKRCSAGWLRNLMVIGQVIVSSVLLIGSVVFTRNSAALQGSDTGLSTTNVVHVETVNGNRRGTALAALYGAVRVVNPLAGLTAPSKQP